MEWHDAKRYRPPIPPQGVLRNASDVASANPTRQKARTWRGRPARVLRSCILSLASFILLDNLREELGEKRNETLRVTDS